MSRTRWVCSKKSHKYDEAKNKTELISFKPIEDGLRINNLYMMLTGDNVNMFHQMQLQKITSTI